MLNCLPETKPLEAIDPKYRRTISCKVCGTYFAGHYSRSLCSDECRTIAKRHVGRIASQKLRDSRSEPLGPRKCKHCKITFEPVKAQQNYCASRCRIADWRKRQGR